MVVEKGTPGLSFGRKEKKVSSSFTGNNSSYEVQSPVRSTPALFHKIGFCTNYLLLEQLLLLGFL
jgi:hypothetical protein